MSQNFCARRLIGLAAGLAMVLYGASAAYAAAACTTQVITHPNGSQSVQCGGGPCADGTACAVTGAPGAKLVCTCNGVVPPCCTGAVRQNAAGGFVPTSVGVCDASSTPPCPPDGLCIGGWAQGVEPPTASAVCIP